MEEKCALFHAWTRCPRCSDGARRTSKVAKRNQRTAELHAAAKLRLQDFLLPCVGDTGADLNPGIRTSIATVINCDRLTYRYMMFVGLLVAVTDKKLHPRCLQMKAKDVLAAVGKEAFDARSLCKNVVVPFEKMVLKGKLGGSGDPYVSNPARLPMVSPGNDVKSAHDRELLEQLYSVLELANDGNELTRRHMFSYAYALVLKRPANETSLLQFGGQDTPELISDMFFDFLEENSQGVAAVAVMAVFFRQYYGVDTRVVVHPINESGASPKEVGDIDLRFKEKAYAVEVKDKPYGEVDVNHACEKALKADVHKVIFVYGSHVGSKRPCDGALTRYWLEKGIDLTFMSVESSLALAMAMSDTTARMEFANGIAQVLIEMKAPQSVIVLFKKIFKKESV